jgi:hypothetical protein
MSDILPITYLNDYEIRDILNKYGGKTDNDFGSKYRKAANVNKWAKFKPQNSDNPFQLSEEERKLGNYGLDLTWSGSARTPQSVLIDMSQGKDFYPYVAPKPPFRSSDYLGYNPNAPAPYSLSCSSTLEVLSFPAYIPFTIKINSEAEFKLTDLAAFEDSFSGGYFAVLCSEGLEINSQVMMHKPSNPEQYKNMLYGEIEVNKAGTYYLAAVYTRIPNEGEITDVSSVVENFMPIPDGYVSVKVTQKTVYAYLQIENLVNVSLYLDKTNLTIGGFGNMPSFTTYFPFGSVLPCSYELGFHVTMDSDWGQYYNEWYYTEQTIDHENGNTPKTTIFANFPAYISLSELLGQDFEYSINIWSITLMPVLRRISGQGFLGFEETPKYDVVL